MKSPAALPVDSRDAPRAVGEAKPVAPTAFGVVPVHVQEERRRQPPRIAVSVRSSQAAAERQGEMRVKRGKSERKLGGIHRL